MSPLDTLILEAVRQAPSPMIITERNGVIAYTNPKFLEHTGYRAEDLLGKNPKVLSAGKTDPRIYKELWETILSGRIWSGELLNRKASGETYWESICISALRDAAGEITHFIGIWQDTTDRKIREDRILRSSITDELTGCFNRKQLTESLEHEVLRARRYKRHLVGIMADIDHFKRVNDRLSHAWGDLVLKGFADILRSSVRAVDIVGRYGGDEFFILLPETPAMDAHIVAERIRSAFRTFVSEQGIPDDFKVTASFGIFALLQEGEISAAAFIEKADHALLAAKRSGKNAIHFH